MYKKLIMSLSALAAGLAATVSFTGCEIDSAESAIRQVNLVVAGFYVGIDGAPIVSQNTGSAITTLNLRQTGDQLEAVDNNGIVFRGTIGNADQSNATITLKGTTSAGQEGIISGSIAVADGTGNMRGTWIEPSLTGTVFAQASDVPVLDPGDDNGGGTGDLSISPNNATVIVGGSQRFTITGGDGTYIWSGASRGSLSPTTGNTTTYTRTSAGQDTIAARDGAGKTGSVTVN